MLSKTTWVPNGRQRITTPQVSPPQFAASRLAERGDYLQAWLSAPAAAVGEGGGPLHELRRAAAAAAASVAAGAAARGGALPGMEPVGVPAQPPPAALEAVVAAILEARGG
jgi:hypothetical protein